MDDINATGERLAMYCSLEVVQEFPDPTDGIPMIYEMIRGEAQYRPELKPCPFLTEGHRRFDRETLARSRMPAWSWLDCRGKGSAPRQAVVLPDFDWTFTPTLKIREVAPKQVEKVRQIAPKFFTNLIRFHNHFTGEAVTTDLNPHEFYLAQQLVDDSSYKEISAKLNMTSGQVNNVVASIYRKLGVHRKADLAKLV